MGFFKIFKKDSLLYWNNDKTSDFLDKGFKKLGPLSMQFLWMNMVEHVLKEGKAVVSVPYKGMIMIVSRDGNSLKSPKFKEIMSESLEFKEGKEVLSNFFIGKFEGTPLADRQSTLSSKLPEWIPKELKGDYSFCIMINMSKVFKHVKKVLEKNKIKHKTSFEELHKKGAIEYDKDKVLNVYEIIRNWILSGATLEILGDMVLFFIKFGKSGYDFKTTHTSKGQSANKRVKKFMV